MESVAENTVDAVVAPAFWGLLGGAPGALGYRAVNTMDATVGHHNERYEDYGWASARLDDVANFVPARLTAALVAAVRPPSRPRRLAGGAPRCAVPSLAQRGRGRGGLRRRVGAAAGGPQPLWGPHRAAPATRLRAGRPRSPTSRRAVTLCRDVTYGLVASLLALARVA